MLVTVFLLHIEDVPNTLLMLAQQLAPVPLRIQHDSRLGVLNGSEQLVEFTHTVSRDNISRIVYNCFGSMPESFLRLQHSSPCSELLLAPDLLLL